MCILVLVASYVIVFAAPGLVMDLRVEFSAQNATRGIYVVTWTPPMPHNGTFYQQLNYSFSSAYTVGPQYNGSVTQSLNQSQNQYNISDALYFTNYTFTISTINVKYNISNGLVQTVNQSLRASTYVCNNAAAILMYVCIINDNVRVYILYILHIVITYH